MTSPTIRTARPGEERTALAPDLAAFSTRLPDAVFDATLHLFETDRMLVAEVGGDAVGCAASFAFSLTVPGGAQVPAAGVTAVGVVPTHRRRGVLRALMAAQLDDVVARGEPVAVLTASESGIYRRFGYGAAAHGALVEIDPTRAALLVDPQAPGRCRLVEGEEAVAALTVAHEAAAVTRPGTLARTPEWWRAVLAEPESFVGGGAPFAVVHEDAAGVPDGYAHYRLEPRWVDGLPAGTLHVGELLGTGPEVEAALLAQLGAVDLVRAVQVWRPVDDWWRHRLVEPRQLRTLRVLDHLWVRLLDVPAALAARRYAGPGSLVLEVADPFRPAAAGRVRLEVAADGTATAAATDEPPDLGLDVADLGAVWLGAVPVRHLAAAALVVEHRAGAVAEADARFAASPSPWCATRF